MYKLILASGSPRRAELLTQLGLRFTVYKPDIDETPYDFEPGLDYVARISLAKLDKSMSEPNVDENAVLICADTTVLMGNKILGKPVDKADAVSMLTLLSGNEHLVVTSVAIGAKKRPVVSFNIETKVKFRRLNLKEIEAYWASGEPADKAGAYGAQGLGSIFIESFSGSYSNVVGLPLMETTEALKEFGISVL